MKYTSWVLVALSFILFTYACGQLTTIVLYLTAINLVVLVLLRYVSKLEERFKNSP